MSQKKIHEIHTGFIGSKHSFSLRKQNLVFAMKAPFKVRFSFIVMARFAHLKCWCGVFQTSLMTNLLARNFLASSNLDLCNCYWFLQRYYMVKRMSFFELNSATSLVHRPHSKFGHTKILNMCSFHYCIVCLPNISNVYKLLARLLLKLTVYIIHENEILSTSKFVPTCVLLQVLSMLIQCFSGLAARHQAHLCY